MRALTIYEKLDMAMSSRDVASYIELLHDDFTVVFHKSGKTFGRAEWADMATGMMANEKFVQESSRCIYENNEILVQHSFMSYPDNTREAVMLVAKIKDGKIVSMETGATPLV